MLHHLPYLSNFDPSTLGGNVHHFAEDENTKATLNLMETHEERPLPFDPDVFGHTLEESMLRTIIRSNLEISLATTTPEIAMEYGGYGLDNNDNKPVYDDGRDFEYKLIHSLPPKQAAPKLKATPQHWWEPQTTTDIHHWWQPQTPSPIFQ